MWQWFYRLGSPKWFYEISGRWLSWISVVAAILLLAGAIWGLAFAPEDYQQGNSFRIIYVHVPMAILAESVYVMMAIAGAISLVWKMKLAEIVAKSVAPLGASFTFLALVSGAIWGKPTWNTYWVWDARLTSMLVLLFLYLGVIALQSAYVDRNQGARASAVLALVGVVNIPIIKYSVEWWNTLHQPASFSVTKSPAMPPEMWVPLLAMVIGFYFLFAALLITRARVEILDREWRTQWVRNLVTEFQS